MNTEIVDKFNGFFLDLFLSNSNIYEKTIIDFKEKIDWDLISKNKRIKWEDMPIDIIIEYANISILSENPSFKIDEYKIYIIRDNLDWEKYTRNASAAISIKTLEDFKDFWHWPALTEKEFLKWPIDIVDKYSKHIDFYALSKSPGFVFDINLIKKYFEQLDWFAIGENINIGWSLQKFEDVHEFLNQKKDVGKLEEFIAGICNQKEIYWIRPVLEKYADYIDWRILSGNPSLKWNIIDINKYSKYISWDQLSENPSIFWYREDIQQYKDKINFYSLSKSGSVSWSFDLIKEFSELWDWYALSENENIPWTEELILEFKDVLNWGSVTNHSHFRFYAGLPKNNSIRWTSDLLEKISSLICWDCFSGAGNFDGYLLRNREIRQKINWELLSENENFEWTEDLIKQHIKKIDIFEIASNKYKIDNFLGARLLENLTEIKSNIYSLGNYSKNVCEKRWSEKPLLSLFSNEEIKLVSPAAIDNIFILDKDEFHFIESDYWINRKVSNILKASQQSIQSEALDFMMSHENLCKSILEFGYKFSQENLRSLKNDLNWKYVSLNRSIAWSAELVEEFKDYLNWKNFLGQSDVVWSILDEPLIYKYSIYVDWDSATDSPHFPWSRRLLDCAIRSEKIKISKLSKLPFWDIELVKKNEQFIDFSQLSENEEFHWDDVAVETFSDRIDWAKLSANPSLSLSHEVLFNFKKKFSFDLLVGNESLPWRKEEDVYYLDALGIECDASDFEYAYEYRPTKSSSIGVQEFLEIYEADKFIDWHHISKNINLEGRHDLIEKHKTQWDWKELCKNPSIGPSLEFVESFGKYIHWIEFVENPSTVVSLSWLKRNWEKFKESDFLPHNIDKIFSRSAPEAISINPNRFLKISFPSIC